MDRKRVLLVACMCLLFAVTVGLAQTTITGSIQGVVKDPKGAVIPGTTVTVTSPALISRQASALTDARGTYRFPALPPGLYSVEVSMTGYGKQTREGLQVRVGQSIAVDFSLSIATVTEEVTVTSKAPVVSVVANTLSTAIGDEYMKSAPLPTNFYNVIKSVPGVNEDVVSGSGSAMLAYGGTTESQNAFTLDGVNVADTGAGQHWVLPSIKWMQVIEIGGLGANAEYGGYTGGVINGVTKSGGNDLHGEIALDLQPDSFTSDSDAFDAGTQPVEKYSNFSVTLGGPIVRDKVWFFVAGERWQTETTPYQTVESWRRTPGTSDRVIPRFLGKVTWQLDPNNRLSFTGEYDNTKNERRGISDSVLAEATSLQEAPGGLFAIHWESIAGNDKFFNVKFTGYDGRDDYKPYNGTDTPGHIDEDSGIAFVNQDIYQKNYRHSLALDASMTWYRDGLFGGNDTHNFKVGGGLEMAKSSDVWRRNGGFTYYDWSGDCGSFEEYLADPSCGPYYIERGWGEYDAAPEYTGWNAYAQDSARFGKWAFNYGLRVGSYDAGWQSGRGNSSVYKDTFFDPRIGFVWDVKGDAKMAVKAHWGRYHEKMYTYLYDREASGNAAIPDQDCYWDYYDLAYTDCDTPTVIAARMGKIDHPYVDELLLTYESQIGRDMVVGVDLADRRFRKIMGMVNVNDDYSLYIADGNPFGGTLPIWILDSEPEFVLTTDNAAYRDYRSAILRFEKRHSNNWDLRASIVYTDLDGNVRKNNGYANELRDRNGLVNADGKMDYAFSPWEYKLGAAWDLPLGFQISGQFTYLTGWYYTPYVRVQDLRDYGFNGSIGRDINLTARGSQQFPSRKYLDLRLAWTRALGKAMTLTASAQVLNATNESTVTDVYNRWGTYYIDDTDHWYQRSNYNDTYDVVNPRVFRAGVALAF